MPSTIVERARIFAFELLYFLGGMSPKLSTFAVVFARWATDAICAYDFHMSILLSSLRAFTMESGAFAAKPDLHRARNFCVSGLQESSPTCFL